VITLRGFTKGVLIGWLSTLLSIAVGLFMSPFLIHHLGEAGYGVWVLVQSTVSYMYFMDLGLRTTVVRFSAQAQARGDHDEVNNVVSAALWIRVWTAGAVIAVAIILVAILPHVFRIPIQYQLTARVALILAATTVASALVFSVFPAVLSGLGRFDLLGTIDLAQVSIVSLGLVPIIRTGHGLIAMASWQLSVVLVFNLVTMAVCFRTYPPLRLRFRKPETKLLRSLWSLGLYVIITNGAGQLILYTDNVVVGAFIGVAAVSYYAIAGKMVEYIRQIAVSILKYVMPLASSFGARNEHARLRQLHLRGTQALLLITYPVVITLIIRGDTLLRVWISAKFSAEATPVLQILSLTIAIMLANANVNGLTLALNRQRTLAFVSLGEGVANLFLSIILVQRIGVIGAAVGTLIPSTITSFFFWPRYLCRMLDMSTVEYLREGWLRPVVALIPFALVTYWAEWHWLPTKLVWFVLQTAVLLPAAILGAVVVFWKDVPSAWSRLTKSQPSAVAGQA
jgi:O-antigen/teichoic acid export membrane protein